MTSRSLATVVLILAVLFLAGCSPNQGQWTSAGASHTPVLPEDAKEWSFGLTKGRIIETAHYRVYTTVQDALLLEKLPVFLETAYQQYLDFFPQAQADQEPLDIYLFDRRSDWEKYTRDNMGAAAEIYLKIKAGGYSYDGISVTYLLPNRYSTFGVLAHEGFHQFVSSRLAHRIPAWMEEGLACNFEAHFWKAGKPDFTPDLNEFRIKTLQQALRRNSLFPISEILTMDAGQAIGKSPEGTATFYAQAWALTRFLQEARHDKYRLAFHRMLTDAADGANLYSRDRAVDIFESYFQEDLATIGEDFLWYARFLAQRKIEPGTEIFLVSSAPTSTTTTITAQQIEQTKPSRISEERPATTEQRPETEPAEPEIAPSEPKTEPETIPAEPKTTPENKPSEPKTEPKKEPDESESKSLEPIFEFD